MSRTYEEGHRGMTDSVEHEVWEARFIAMLVWRGLDRETAESCAKEALSHCHETQETPEEAFGDLEEYADRTATAHIPVSRRMKTGSFSDYTVGEFWKDLVEFPGNYLALAGIVLWIMEGLWTRVTVAGLTGVSLLGLALALGSGAQTLFMTAGRPRAAVVALVPALGAAGCVPLSLQLLPRTELAQVPSPAIVAAGLVLIFLTERATGRPAGERLFNLRRRGGGKDASTALDGTAEAGRPGPAPESAGHGDREAETRRWLRRLDGLLLGRHFVARRERRRLVAEARAHLAETGAHPHEEFGDVERYVLTLVEEGAVRRPTRRAVTWTAAAVWCALSVVILVDEDWSDPGWSVWLRLLMVAVVGWWLVKHHRDKWPARTAGSASAKNE